MFTPGLPTACGEGLFCVFVVRNTRTTVVWIVGEVDLNSEEQLAYVAFALRGLPDVVVDLSRVTFCDQTLVRFLAELERRHLVTLRDPPRLCRDVLLVSAKPRAPRPGRLKEIDELPEVSPSAANPNQHPARGSTPCDAGPGARPVGTSVMSGRSSATMRAGLPRR